ncbi:hypothetical protein ASPCADRAFT_208127 [Aspergillus carbonarius ITEM 5010]|uniref:Uncharacterized protein n=1 Tax=Aspergillus carbonarius (strain ITEM 5010) TaxID=602072 RepID=A0A1R3RM91_ASPC5|nr:hypothetical protein ASPCADRAFT_208127 [Aspergillus carbonarius ITEM 5010]
MIRVCDGLRAILSSGAEALSTWATLTSSPSASDSLPHLPLRDPGFSIRGTSDLSTATARIRSGWV